MKLFATLFFSILSLSAKAEIKTVDFFDFEHDIVRFAGSLGNNGYAQHPFDFSRCSFQVSTNEGYLTISLKTERSIKEINIAKDTIISVEDSDHGSFFKNNEAKPFLSIQTYPGVFQRAKINIDGEIEYSGWMDCIWELK